MMQKMQWEDREHEKSFSWHSWVDRIRLMHLWIDETVTSVLDLGAGDMRLQTMLPNGTVYYPVDYVARNDQTIVCDFRKREFPAYKADLCFVSGALEYVYDPDWFLAQIKQTGCRFLLLSYCVLCDDLPVSAREERAWQNHLTFPELMFAVQKHGFILTDINNHFPNAPLLRFEAATPETLTRNYYCTGCSACASGCPTKALTMHCDTNGFLKPVLSEALCSQCAQCFSRCPVLRPRFDNTVEPKVYAAMAEDQVREHSSSGGAFTLLANEMFRRGGIVFGAAWNNDFTVHHIAIENEAMLPLLRHSKYLQSNVEETFSLVKHYLAQKRPVLYVGCPCQIAGLYAYLGEKPDGLISVDLLCHHVPSPKIIQRYLDENYGLDRIKAVTFRDKSQGWFPDTQKIETSNGIVDIRRFSSDWLQQGYHPRLYMNDTCQHCFFAALPRQGDITIGDFWGLVQNADWNDGKGTSEILINSDKGESYFRDMKSTFARIDEMPIAIALANRIATKYVPHAERDHFLRLLQLDGFSFNRAVEWALNRKFQIALVGDWSVENYGANITYYALYSVLTEQLGYDVLLVERPVNAEWKPATPPTKFRFLPYPSYALEPYAATKRELRALNSRCETFLVGSDQIFNAYLYRAFGKFCTLDWVDNSHYKAVYAASFGKNELIGTEDERAEMMCFMKKFDAFSVRERSAVKLLKEQFDVDGTHVLDPVFLCDQANYYEMAKKGGVDELKGVSYLFSYCLDITDLKANMLYTAREALSLDQMIVLTDIAKNTEDEEKLSGLLLRHNASVEEWIAYIAGCSFMITDSYHGVCVAIIMKKPFLAIANEGRGEERFISLLKTLGLMDRLISSTVDSGLLPLILKPIDYSSVDALLLVEISRSRLWLSNTLKQRAKKKSLTEYDILDRSIEQLERQIAEQYVARIQQEQAMHEMRQQLVSVSSALHGLIQSRSYRLGFSLTWLPRKIKGGVRCIRENGFRYTWRRLKQKIKNRLSR